MRRTLVLTTLLLALAVASLSFIHGLVDEDKDSVSISETVLYGDKSVAEGLAVDLSAHCDHRLFWDTRYIVGEKPEISTDFVFSQAQRTPKDSGHQIGIHIDHRFGGYGASSTGNLDLEDEPIPIRDVAGRTKPGETRTEVVCIKDYYDYYPIRVGLDRRAEFAINQDTLDHFADFFKIPVHPNHRVEIKVQKDTSGNVRRIEMNPIDDGSVYFEVADALTDSGYFFTLSCLTEDGKLLDTSNIPGGYGIYYYPLHNEGGDDRILTADELRNVFPLDAERARVAGLQTSNDKSRLLLVTLEDETYMLTVIDAETVTKLQKIELMTAYRGSGPVSVGPQFRSLHICDGFLVSQNGDGRFTLLALGPDGRYEVRFRGDFSLNEHLKKVFAYQVLQMDFNGEELAVAAFQDGLSSCSFYLAVYNERGLAYAGQYHHSLDRDRPADHRLGCRPVYYDALSVSWGKKS